MNSIFTSRSDLQVVQRWKQKTANCKVLLGKYLLKMTSLSGKTQHNKEKLNSWRGRTKMASIETAIINIITAVMFNEGTLVTVRCVPNSSIGYYSSGAVTGLLLLWDNVGKCGRARQAQALCMLAVQNYRRTLRISNTHCFPTTAVVWRTGLDVRLPAIRLSCHISVFCQLLSWSHNNNNIIIIHCKLCCQPVHIVSQRWRKVLT